MNSKPISLITAAGGLAVLAAGCCCNKIVTERETPQITLQPENVETSTNRESYALLTLDIAREPKEGYQFAWFKETLAKDCTSEGDSVALRTELQTKRPGCFTDMKLTAR